MIRDAERRRWSGDLSGHSSFVGLGRLNRVSNEFFFSREEMEGSFFAGLERLEDLGSGHSRRETQLGSRIWHDAEKVGVSEQESKNDADEVIDFTLALKNIQEQTIVHAFLR